MCSFQGVSGRRQDRGERAGKGLDRGLLGLATLLLQVAGGPLDERVQARIGCLAVSYDIDFKKSIVIVYNLKS